MSKQLVSIIDVPKHVGEEITIGAWVANKSGKGKLAFLQLRDGTAFFQAVAFKPNFIEKYGEEEGTEKFDTVKRLSQETSVYVTGVVKEDERSKFGYELDVTAVEVIGESHDYPITPKEHGTDFLMDNRHLWLRSRKQMAIQQIRNALSMQLMISLIKMASSNLIVLSCLVMLLKIQQNCLKRITLVHLLT